MGVWSALLVACSAVVCLRSTARAGNDPSTIGLHFYSQIDPRVALLRESNKPVGLSLDTVPSGLLKVNLPSLKRQVRIDSTGTNIAISEELSGYPFALPAYLTLSEYVQVRARNERDRLWQERVVQGPAIQGPGGRTGAGAIVIDIPVEIKSQAFQRIFGGGRVGLDVTGDISIKGGFRHEKRSEVKTALNRGSDYNFKMEQTQRFNVSGHIGEKVKVLVDQDSERAFDFDNAISLRYQGVDDEIVKSIDAGNISLSLPATQFVTFSGKNTGLFGVRADMEVGRLKLTTIASQEKGQGNKISLSGGAKGEKQRIEDYQYRRGTYFFLDEYYYRQFPDVDEQGRHRFYPPRSIKRLELYKSEPGYETRYSDSIRGFAGMDIDTTNFTFEIDTTNTQLIETGYFRRLEKNTDYFLERDLGYVQMMVPLGQGEVLAVAYEDSSGRIVGDINYQPEAGKPIILRLLKPRVSRPAHPTWILEWRNVYYLGSRNIAEDGFELKIYYKPPSGDPQEAGPTKSGQVKSYLQIFGLDRVDQTGSPNPDNRIDMNANIINLARGELIFPDLRPFDPLGPTELPNDKRTRAIYDTTVQSYIAQESKFYIEVSSKIRRPDYDLGMNVIEGSEEVRLNGVKLVKDRDYTIDYWSGKLLILNEAATQPSADVEITYESNQMFQIERKTILGARAQYDLWQDSFIGGTALYLGERTLEQKIRVGRGPMQNFVWDLNTQLRFKPNFLTTLANALPFVNTQAPSTLNIEAEMAQVFPNPNTVNNEKTGDNDGVAYIDDFEGSKRETIIGIDRRGWTPASVPLQKKEYAPHGEVSLAKMGSLIWYNPYNQVPIKYIWPTKDVNPNVPQRVNVLTLRFSPADSVPSAESWAGIQRALSSGYADQTESKFLEIWVQGDVGVLHVDLGQVSEDVIPNGRLDTEDRAVGGIRNGVLDPGEDVGLDGMANNDPRARAAGGDFWDINGNGVRDYGEPWSNDDFHYQPGIPDYDQINGYEGNENDTGGRYPDTEDINRNGDVDLRNDYFEYSFSLDKSSPDTVYMVGGKGLPPDEDHGWRQYRIPLDQPSRVVGNPDISLVEYMRVWVDGVPNHQPVYISIAELKLVGSDWKEQGVAGPSAPGQYDARNDSTVVVTVVNTHDNPEYKENLPPGVEGVRDRITQAIAREQSLVLKVTELQPGYNGIIQKSLYQPEDYIHYKTMKMFVYGKDPYGIHIRSDQSLIHFFLRFGSDAKNYYEIREPVYPGWDRRNEIEVDLLELSAIKLDPSNRVDSLSTQGSPVFEKYLPDGKRLRIVGRPSLTNVRILVAGVENLAFAEQQGTKVPNVTPFTGEIWINELRLSNVKKDRGVAYRASVDFALADLARVTAQVNRQDADFHNVNTRFGSGDNRTGMNFTGSLALDKLLPQSLGISIPVNVNYSESAAIPKYVPGTDIEVTDRTPDSTLSAIKTLSTRRGFGVSFRRVEKSRNFFVKHTIDNITANYSESSDEGSNSQTAISRNRNQTGGMRYNLTFGRDNFFQPFSWLAGVPVLKKLSVTKMYYTPAVIGLKVSGTRSTMYSRTRSGVESYNNVFNVTRDANASMRIFDNLSLDYGRSHTSDLRNVPREEWSRGKLGVLTAVSQNFKVQYNPKIFTWLSNSLNYNSDYRYNYNQQQRDLGRSASTNASVTASGSVNLSQLLTSIRRPSAPPTRPVPGRTPPSRQPPGSKQPQPEQPKKSGGSFNLFDTMHKVFGMVDPISVSYSKRTSTNLYGLAPGTPRWQFQFGLSDSCGLPVAAQNVGSNRGSRSETESLNFSSGLKPSRQITITVKYSESSTVNRTTTVTGNESQNWFRSGNTDLPLPEWTVRWRGFERYLFFKKMAQSVSLDHGFTGQKRSTWGLERGIREETRKDYDANFRPLIGMNITWKNGMTSTLRFNKGQNLSESMGVSKGQTRTQTMDITFTTNYSKRSNFRIPLPVWPFKNAVLKNNVDLSVTFNMNRNVTEKSKAAGIFEETARTEKWSFMPKLTYAFSNRVRGGVSFEVGKTKNKLIGDSSIQELALDVNISIRGN
ncbi:MAG: cell surface protein SprA [bacterium]|nr:cell surface protein SprA [candidate division KSB1 bacterium]MDH7561402.1 cell surface protein SprA [bacterium]